MCGNKYFGQRQKASLEENFPENEYSQTKMDEIYIIDFSEATTKLHKK